MYSLCIIDDDNTIRVGLTSFFPWQEIGFKVVSSFSDAESFYEFMTNIPEPEIDAVLCDVILPGMNGIQLAEKLQDLKIYPKFVFLSAWEDFEYVHGALKIQAEDYILKPTDFEELSRVFKKIKMQLDELCSDENEHKTADELLFESIDNYFNANIQNASLLLAADIAKMNPSYFSRFFKAKTGVAFSEYILKKRMEKAKELLKDYSLRIGEISQMIGYADGNSFARAFLKYEGTSPSEYRTKK